MNKKEFKEYLEERYSYFIKQFDRVKNDEDYEKESLILSIRCQEIVNIYGTLNRLDDEEAYAVLEKKYNKRK